MNTQSCNQLKGCQQPAAWEALTGSTWGRKHGAQVHVAGAPGGEGVGNATAEAGHISHCALQLRPPRLAGRQRSRQPLSLHAALLA